MSKISILQLNTFNFHLPEKILNFIKKHKPDIITMQEVSTGELNNCNDKITNFLEKIKTEFNMNRVYAPKYGWTGVDGGVHEWGNAILTTLPIVDYQISFQPSLQNYTVYNHKHPFFHIQGNSLEAKNSRYEYAFEQAKNVLSVVIKTKEGKLIRVVTTHLTVSYKCSETLQIIQQTNFLLNQLNLSAHLPTIIAGDFNIHPQSGSIGKILKNGFTCLNTHSKNSLDRTVHVLFENEVEHEGLNVDYIFAKGFKNGSAEVLDTAGISDHAPVLGWVEL